MNSFIREISFLFFKGESVYSPLFLPFPLINPYSAIIFLIIFKDITMSVKQCNTLEEARLEIDKVDKEIVKLIAKRNDYIKQIAHFKTSIDEVKAEERIADVISKVRQQAIELDLSPNLINDLYVRMIDGMVESEIAEFRNAKGL